MTQTIQLPPHRPTVEQRFPHRGFVPRYSPRKERPVCDLAPSRYPTI